MENSQITKKFKFKKASTSPFPKIQVAEMDKNTPRASVGLDSVIKATKKTFSDKSRRYGF